MGRMTTSDQIWFTVAIILVVGAAWSLFIYKTLKDRDDDEDL